MNNKECTPERRELMPLAQVMAQRFIQRWDMYPKQRTNGSYVAMKRPLTLNHILKHLRGDITLGAYLLSPDDTCRFMVLDADDNPEGRQLHALANVLHEMDCPTYLENSRRGGHLWFFFDTPVEAVQVRQFGQGLLDFFRIHTVELYPKQDFLKSGPGSLIRLPFGIHRKSGKRYGFYNAQGEILAPTIRDQIQVLSEAQTTPKQLFDRFMSYAPEPKEKPILTPVKASGETVSDRIKAAATVHQFVLQYVELNPSGRGLCPFHDDKVDSFGVNQDKNYWSCFAGCGGGSIIDFYMLYQERVEGRACDFTTAVTELADILLE